MTFALVEPASGFQLAGGSADGSATQIFELEDRLVAAINGQIGNEIHASLQYTSIAAHFDGIAAKHPDDKAYIEHRKWMALNLGLGRPAPDIVGKDYWAAPKYLDFVPATNAAATTFNAMTVARCNQCHDPLALRRNDQAKSYWQPARKPGPLHRMF